MNRKDLTTEIARPSQVGLRSAWQWRPLASLTPGAVADLLRRAAMGDARDFLLAADDIREKDLHYRAVLQTRTLAVAGLPVDIQPWDDSRAAVAAADLVRQALEAIDLPGLIAHLMDAVAKGYAVAEIVWDTHGRTWLPARIEPREAHWFTFDRDSGRTLRLADGSPEGADIPPYRMIQHVPPLAAGVPLLGGVARSALWAWVFKSYAMRDWARFAELYGQPIRIGKYPDSASPDDVAVLRQAAFGLGSDAAAVIPEGMALELVEAAGKAGSAELYHGLIDYLDRQVSKAVLGQTMTTDSSSSGSLAQARVHAEVRDDILRADARAIAATLLRDLIGPLVRLNLGEDAPLPSLRLVADDPDDLAGLAQQVVQLQQAGLPIPQWWVRERFGIPEAQPGEAVLDPAGSGPIRPDPAPSAQAATPNVAVATPDVAPHGPGCGCGMPAAHAAGAAAAPLSAAALDLPERHADRLEEATATAWAAIMDRIKALVDEADSLPALRDALLAAYADLPQDTLAEVMAMAFAAADLAGRLAAQADSEG